MCIDDVISDEILRERVRTQLNKRPSASSKFWKIVNSPIFLWFLSSVLIAFIASQYDNYSKNLEKKRNLEVRIVKLKTEISYRLDTDLFKKHFEDTVATKQSPKIPDLSQFSLSIPPKPAHVEAFCYSPSQFNNQFVQKRQSLTGLSLEEKTEDMIEGLLKSRFIYPEMRDRSIFSLLWELGKIDSESENKPLLDEAITSITNLRKAAISNDESKTVDEYFVPINELLTAWKS